MSVRSLMTTVVLLASLSAMPFSAAAQPSDAATTTLVLDTPGMWRMYHVFQPPIIQTQNGSLEPLKFNVAWLDWDTPAPPANWTSPEMNDRTWMRGPARRCARTPYLSRLCLRGKFEVTDPAAVGDLTVSLEYYGGAVVYLNGKEIGRGHLPAGKKPAEALAQPYPMEAFLDAKGEPVIPSSKGQTAELHARTLSLPVPRNLLRKGINVLAIEIVRALYPAALLDKHPRGVGGISSDPALMWNTCEIRKAVLSASKPDGLVPNTGRPAGIQVWNGDTLAGDTDVDYGDRTEPLEPIALTCPRNGAPYGKIVVGSDKPLKGLKAVASDLKADGAVIPSNRVSFMYAVPGGDESLPPGDALSPYPDRAAFLNALLRMPLDEFPVAVRSRTPSRVNGAVVPLWVHVKAPKDARPGLYKGTVTITAAGEPTVTVPLHVNILPWTLPDPQDFRTWVELIQSPDTLAVEYNVPLWSDKHFELIARSFDLVKDTGTRSLYIPVIAHTNLGNAESMVRWIDKGNGTYDWDFTIMDRYLDTAEKYLGGKPKMIVLQVWEVYMNTPESTGRRFGEILKENQKNTGGAPLVTFVDASGKTENRVIPKLNHPSSKAVWKELMTKVRNRLKARGLENTIQLGMFTDSFPNKEDTKFFQEVAPGLGWVQHGHNAFLDVNGMVPTGYTATWWSARFADDLVNRRSGAVGKTTYRDHETKMTSLFGWNRPRRDAYYPRMTNEQFPVSYWRFLCETAVTSDFYCGIGRLGLDYWPCIKNPQGRRVGWVNERFVEVAGYLHKLHSYMVEPQADGPVAMTRLPAMEEGIHECEARIYIEDALVNKQLDKKAPELAKRCRECLDERLKCMWTALNNMQCGGWGVTAWRFQAGVSGHAWLLGMEQHKRNAELFKLAGEVEQCLRQGP